MEKLINILNIPTNRTILIEASAGTGKTFTIVLLYLRLLLGINTNKNKKKFLSIQEILILTFTNSAKEEIKKRIKESIYCLKISCIKKKNINKKLNLIFKQIKDFKKTISLLLLAEQNIESASIYTIHGFCQYILSTYQLYSNINVEKKIINDEHTLYLNVVNDFWRKYCYFLPKEIMRIVLKEWNGPKSIFNSIFPILKTKIETILSDIKPTKTITQHYQDLLNDIKKIKTKWLLSKDIIFLEIKNLNLNKHVYNNRLLNKWENNITLWAKEETKKNLNIPNELKYFQKKTLFKNMLEKKNLKNSIFIKIEKFFSTSFSLKEIILQHALIKIPILLKKEKKKQSIIEFDDLLLIVKQLINRKKINIKSLIRKQFPVTFIDEFQDTDNIQYNIFKSIYFNKNNGLILVGDPKQSIYSFRGSDVFSYLKSKLEIDQQYYLKSNWRSSANMVESINFLYSRIKNPFLLNNIQYIPININSINHTFKLIINGKLQTGLHLFFKKNIILSMKEYQTWIAKQCAIHINNLLQLSKQNKATISINEKIYPIQKHHFTILVRNKKEATLIQKELKNVNINSIYQPHTKNIYSCQEAQEILLILKAILEPTNSNIIKQALITNIISKNIIFIEKINNEIESFYLIVKKFINYFNIWNNSGIFYMLQRIINDHILAINEKNVSITNISHLGELLQEKSLLMPEKNTLIYWFEQKIFKKNKFIKNKHLVRSKINENTIHISSIHQSKGLEYLITWIPFAANFNKNKFSIFHDRHNFKKIIDLNKNKNNLKLAKEELLSEEIRILYVALTRSILACYIGLAPIQTKKKFFDKNMITDLHKSALGYIIQKGKKLNYQELCYEIKKINSKDSIHIHNKDEQKKEYTEKNIFNSKINTIKIHNINKPLINQISILSYSKLTNQQEKKSLEYDGIKYQFLKNSTKDNKIELTPHTFPKGKIYGSILHDILQKTPFNSFFDTFQNSVINKHNLSKKWISFLKSWIINIFDTPLNNDGLKLSKLLEKEHIKELEFFIPIKNSINSKYFNYILKKFDNISKLCDDLNFDNVNGMLTGSIDLVFLWKEKYYLLDYKSNWIGNKTGDYTYKNLKKQIIYYRYDLQYHIYSLALHKYLTNRIKNYSFHTHFGGIFYLFLRGLNKKTIKQGIFFTIPKFKLITKLDHFFLNIK